MTTNAEAYCPETAKNPHFGDPHPSAVAAPPQPGADPQPASDPKARGQQIAK